MQTTEPSRNRAILLTAPGSAAIAVVRMVGPGIAKFLTQHFRRPVADGRCVHGELRDGDRVLDDPVVVVSQNGTVADINLHGGPWIVRSMLDLAAREGFETSEQTEISLPLDAVDGDSILEREMLAYLPMARTELALRVLLAQPEAWAAWEARGMPDRRRVLADRSLHWLLHPPRVAIVGIPNAGKSTLANQLFAQERSITADLPGTTRDWVGEIANIEGLAVRLVDTPGIRYDTVDPIEREAIARSAAQIAHADLIVVVLDPTQPLVDQARLLRAHPHALRVLNKSDRRPAKWDISSMNGLATVATTGQGIDALRRRILEHFGCASIDPVRPRIWTDRQKRAATGT